MRRREFIRLIGGAVAAWPLAARAQQPSQVQRVGVPMSTGASDAEGRSRLAAFLCHQPGAAGRKYYGFTSTEYGMSAKGLELLKEIAPGPRA